VSRHALRLGTTDTSGALGREAGARQPECVSLHGSCDQAGWPAWYRLRCTSKHKSLAAWRNIRVAGRGLRLYRNLLDKHLSQSSLHGARKSHGSETTPS